jgi:hypothetical protein
MTPAFLGSNVDPWPGQPWRDLELADPKKVKSVSPSATARLFFVCTFRPDSYILFWGVVYETLCCLMLL